MKLSYIKNKANKLIILLRSKRIGKLFTVILTVWGVAGLINEIAPWNSAHNNVFKIFDKNYYEVNFSEEKLKPFDDPSLVIFANDKNYKDFCPSEFKNYPDGDIVKITLRAPEIRILEKRNNPIVRILTFSKYKTVFSFKPKLIPNQDHLGGENLFIYKTDVTDLNGDSTKEIIAQIMTTTCGSGSEVYNFIFSYQNNEYKLTQTLPDILYFNEVGPKSSIRFNQEEILKRAKKEGWKPVYLFEEKSILNKNKEIKIRYTDTDTFIAYRDLDLDNQKEIILALPIWEQDECHWCKHKWMVGVYKYKNGLLNIDPNFNDSLILITDEKYDLYDILGYKILPTNPFGIISQFYGLGFMIWKTEDLEPEFLIRKESEIWNIIKLHYGK